ncbi:unnamed protein product [Soboliphyme baturini]|uniref:G_PROTEIN_RECEP_F1_2 domain-containing protein n=1 Tax=Soboliphyme baturini TaxID=241478 RepID=A0A183I9S5_9BILA|nr:unnamed protein product [Soboliphyme baturini]
MKAFLNSSVTVRTTVRVFGSTTTVVSTRAVQLLKNVTLDDASRVKDCVVSYDKSLVVITAVALLLLLSPAIVYNLLYFKLLLSNRHSEPWIRIMLLNVSACTMLHGLAMMFMTVYNVFAIRRLLDSAHCRWINYPAASLYAVNLTSVVVISIVLLLNSYSHGQSYMSRKKGVIVMLLLTWTLAFVCGAAYNARVAIHQEFDCFCHHILTTNHTLLFSLHSVELFALFIAVVNFSYVFRRSRMKVLHFDISNTEQSLSERVLQWKTATNARNVLPWAIVHSLFMTFIVAVSVLVVFEHERVTWRMRIAMIMSTMYLQTINILVQPLILIRSSYSLSKKVEQLPMYVRRIFIPCVCVRRISFVTECTTLMSHDLSFKTQPSHVTLQDFWSKERKRIWKHRKGRHPQNNLQRC